MRTRPPVVITDDAGARRLAALLNGVERTRPVVVVTTPAGREHPYIDVGDLLQHVGDVTDIYVVGSGPHTWTFSRAMVEGTQVYGGAGRVYPVGHDWVDDVRRSPLRLAFDADEGRRATERLVSDAMTMAAEAGLFGSLHQEQEPAAEVTGRVVGIPHTERAIVVLDSRDLVTVVPELVVPGVALERLLVKGMPVRGRLDRGSRRLDLRTAVRPASEVLAGYEPGRLVLAEVTGVGPVSVHLRLHPEVEVEVGRAEVTANELDDLQSLMTAGEVLPARVVAVGPDWRLTLLDVDDDEAVLPPPALLTGGPPWLEEVHLDRVAEHPTPTPSPGVPRVPEDAPGRVEGHTPPARPPSARAPSPLLLDKRRGSTGRSPGAAPSGPSAPPGSGSRAPAEEVAALERAVADLEARADRYAHQVVDLTHERALLHDRVRQLEHELRRTAEEIRRLRTENRKRGQRRRVADAAGAAGPEFADAEQGFRYRVVTAWATRTPPGEQAARPLLDYDLGPDFLASLALPGVDLAKVADVVVEVVTGRAHEIPGRELHQLRAGSGGGAAYVRRDRDGASCWRASLQSNAPQARRLHYWMLPQGRIELSRVVLHDDMTP